MAQSNDSILITPGSGATVATHNPGDSKEYQVVMMAGERGHIWGSADAFIVETTNTANVAASRTTRFDLFNASGSGVVLELSGIYIIPTLTAVTGVGLTWELIKTSAVGTGGTTLTPRALDSDNASLPSQVTARTSPTGGATTNHLWLSINTSSEETLPYGSLSSNINHIAFALSPDIQNITLREGQGIKIDQTTSSSVGSTNIRAVFSVK